MVTEPSKSLSHYRLVEKIGEGGMGVIWRADDLTLHRPVALKFLTSTLFGDEKHRARFLREARTAAALNHPGICTIFDMGEVRDGEEGELAADHVHAGTPFIAMEMVEGKTLEERLKHGPPPLEELLDLSLQMADAMAAAHASRIVHRDLKPANVKITDEGRVKILDFGLAKPFTQADPEDGETLADTISAELTREGKVMGTVAYMSPEQAQGKPVDSRSDVFAFGTILHEMMAGARPFRGENMTSTMAKILEAEPEPLPGSRQTISPELERIALRCLRKSPDDRYNDTRDLLAALKDLRRSLYGERTTSATGVTAAVVAPRRGVPAWAWGLGGLVAVLAIVVAVMQLAPSGGTSAPTSETAAAPADVKRIVVFPFENLGSPEDEYFADGVTEEITGRLARASGLGVISRSSAFQYERTGKTTRQIGEDFQVDYILEGTVRWAPGADGTSRVRITPELIRVADDTHLWSGTYDRVLDDIFEVQSEIAGEVIGELDVTLLGREGGTLAEEQPTENMEAYNAFLRGKFYANIPGLEDEARIRSVEMFKRAVSLDPTFVEAQARLAIAQAAMYHFGVDRTPERQALARRAAATALELDPEDPRARVASGMVHYWGHKQYDKALAEFAIAERSLPNDVELLAGMGYVKRRQGRWEEALDYLQRAAELNPRDPGLANDIGDTLEGLRRYAESIKSFDEAIALQPDGVTPYWNKARIYWLWTGKDDARATLQLMPDLDDSEGLWAWFWQGIYDRNYQEALDRLDRSKLDALQLQEELVPRDLLRGVALGLLDRSDEARAAYGAAREWLEGELDSRPDDHRVYSALGLTLAGLGMHDEAIQAGERAVELFPLSRDAMAAPARVHDLAKIYALVGDREAALEQIRILAARPTEYAPILRFDPRWDILRDDPSFPALVEKFSKPIASGM
jgi:eukaryotic-like serine/threonine-protein kinase